MAWGMTTGHPPSSCNHGGAFIGAVPSTSGHFHGSYGDFLTSSHLLLHQPQPTSAHELLGMNPTGSHPEHSVMAEPQPSP